MNLRQAKKIINQETPPETDSRNRGYRDRYKKANAYISKLYKNRLRKQRKEGKKFLSTDEIARLITSVIEESNFETR